MKKLLTPVLGLALLIPCALPTTALAADEVKIKSTAFVGMPAPNNVQDMAKLYTTASLQVTYTDGSVRSFPLTYKTLFKTTDTVNGTVAGLATDVTGKPVMDNSVPSNPTPFVSDDPDSNSLFHVAGMKDTSKGGNALSLVTHYEYITSNNAGKSAYGMVPASMSLTTIDQNKTTGELLPVDLKKIDFSAVDGLWIPCNGSLTPWNTHLGSEEYEPDARAYEKDNKETYTDSFTKNYFQDDNKVGNPYSYGWMPEITVQADNSTSVVKHYSLGRFSHELGSVAPDHKTVFFGDDGGNTMLFMYVADKGMDLSAGTMYAAKWIQTSDQNGGAATLQWINLGHASDSEIKAYVDNGLKFSDMFEVANEDTPGFAKIKSYPSGKVEWLKVIPGMEKAAAFLEARRYAATLGATSEFNKMEGVAHNAKDKKVYVAMSYLEKAMEKDSKGADPVDDISVKKIRAGVVYEMPMSGGQKDSSGADINSEYVASKMSGLVVGSDLAIADAKGNLADDEKIANPDNIAFSEELRTLFIGEDSGMHVNNYVWAYNVDTKKLSRILSTPAGAEATGLQVVDNLKGFSYIMSNIQHPGDEMIVADSLKADVEAQINKNFDNKKSGAVGYIHGVPTPAQMVAWKDSDKTLAVLRELAESKGGKVTWNQADYSVSVTKGSSTMKVKIGESSAIVNGQTIQLPYAAKLENERTMFPTAVLNEFLK